MSETEQPRGLTFHDEEKQHRNAILVAKLIGVIWCFGKLFFYFRKKLVCDVLFHLTSICFSLFASLLEITVRIFSFFNSASKSRPLTQVVPTSVRIRQTTRNSWCGWRLIDGDQFGNTASARHPNSFYVIASMAWSTTYGLSSKFWTYWKIALF